MVFSLGESAADVPAKKDGPAKKDEPAKKMEATVADRWLLWVDGVGGYLLLPGDDWTIGGPTGSDDAEICVQGDLSRREACIRRQQGDYILQPLGTVLLGGRRMQRPAMLRDGDRLTLGPRAAEVGAGGAEQPPQSRGVRFEFAKPHPLSASARLRLDSRHKTLPRSDAVILLADTCVLGPTRASHILTPLAEQEVILVRSGTRWFCRGGEETYVAGELQSGRVEVPVGARLETAGLSFSLERVA